jgi:hypothetical protein
MKVFLNGSEYVIRAGTTVTRSPIVEWPDNIRYDGQQLRKDRRLISSWEINDISGGLGKKELESGGNRLWDAENVDTRYPGQIILSPAFVTCTLSPSRGDISPVVDWRGQLHFFSTTGSVIHRFTPPDILGSYYGLGLSVVAGQSLGDKVLLVFNNGGAYHYDGVGSGAVGSAFNAAITTATADFTRVADVGGTAHVLTWNGSTYDFFILPRIVTGSVAAVASIPGIGGSYLSPLVSNGKDVYAALPQGVYSFGAVPAMVIDTGRAQDRNPNQVLFRQNLLLKNKTSLLKWDGASVESVGYDREDGLPSDKMGQITAMCSSWQNVFASVKGATYSHILSYDGSAWQYYARWPTAGIWVKDMFLSDSPDAIDRLWCLPGNDPSNIGYFLNPMVNPLQAGTYSYVPSGHYTTPIYGGGMSEMKGGWYRATVVNDGKIILSTGYQNSGMLQFGVEGAAPTYARTWLPHPPYAYPGTYGWFMGSCNTDFMFGSEPGIEASRIQLRMILTGGTYNGTTPNIKNIVVSYLKDPPKRYTYEFDIDVNDTVVALGRDTESILGSLACETNSKILLPFQYGQMPTSMVKVLSGPSSEILASPRELPRGRDSFVHVVLAEIVV